MPISVMGVREEENLCLCEEGRMDVKYVPLFLKQYPFVFTFADAYIPVLLWMRATMD